MSDEPEKPRDDPARSWDDGDSSPREPEPEGAERVGVPLATEPETVGTGSYVAVSCVAAMGLLLVVLIAGLLISRWIG